MKILRKPNLFIIGAPKCGTTALAEYLNEHENIFISNPKEIHYFSTDIPGYSVCTSEKEYLNLFKKITSKHRIVGEASVFHLYSEEALKNIYNFNKDAKIIVMLRNPVEMVYSLHAQLLLTADENIEDFSKAWDLISERKKGSFIPPYCRAKQLLFFDEIAMYGKQLELVYKFFQKKQVKIIFFEDFKSDTKKVYEEVIDFLSLFQDNRIDFPIVNENTIARNKKFNEIIKKQPYGLRFLNKWLKKIIKVKSFGVKNLLKRMNTKKVKRTSLTEEMRAKIINSYKEDIHALSNLTNKNLDKWLT